MNNNTLLLCLKCKVFNLCGALFNDLQIRNLNNEHKNDIKTTIYTQNHVKVMLGKQKLIETRKQSSVGPYVIKQD